MTEQEKADLEMDRWMTEQWEKHPKTQQERREDQAAFEAFQQWRDEDR